MEIFNNFLIEVLLMDKILFLYLKDLKISYILIKKLDEKRIKWHILENLASIHHKDSLIISNNAGIAEIKVNDYFDAFSHYYDFLNYENFQNYDSLIIYILKGLWSIYEYSNLLCAIDPGQFNIGIAFFLDKKLICTEIVHEPSKVIEIINLYSYSLKPKYLSIKIGTGNDRSLRDIIRLFIATDNEYKLEKNAKIYLVDEFGTSKKKYYYKKTFYDKNITNDEKAAITIGIRKGEILYSDTIKKILNKKANSSELKHIQHLSRKKSNGKISLSRELAENVYQGNITIEKALEIQENKKKVKKQ